LLKGVTFLIKKPQKSGWGLNFLFLCEKGFKNTLHTYAGLNPSRLFLQEEAAAIVAFSQGEPVEEIEEYATVRRTVCVSSTCGNVCYLSPSSGRCHPLEGL